MSTKWPNLLSVDLDYILENTLPLWEQLRDQRLFITGGTGFFGCWLLESFVWANEKLQLNANAIILTRNVAQFAKKCPHLVSEPSLTFQEGDIKNFNFPKGDFSHVIHAATEASVSLNKNHPELMYDTIVQGTKHMLEFALQRGAQRFLLTSSGAVYGQQPSHLSHIPEDYVGPLVGAEEIKSAYADGKREAEKLCQYYAEQFQLDIKIARCFAFVGPHLPLDTHFAIGNFIRDGLAGKTIKIKGDGRSYRSYLYAADLAIWLWTILFCGKTMHPYNVGGDEALTIKDLAQIIATIFKSTVEIQMTQPSRPGPPERYVPDISRARSELNLIPRVSLARAITLTREWYSSIY